MMMMIYAWAVVAILRIVLFVFIVQPHLRIVLKLLCQSVGFSSCFWKLGHVEQELALFIITIIEALRFQELERIVNQLNSLFSRNGSILDCLGLRLSWSLLGAVGVDFHGAGR